MAQPNGAAAHAASEYRGKRGKWGKGLSGILGAVGVWRGELRRTGAAYCARKIVGRRDGYSDAWDGDWLAGDHGREQR